MDYLSGIDSFAGDNLGSVIELQVARVLNVVSMPYPFGSYIIGDIVFAADKGFVQWKFTKGTANFSGKSKVTQEGELITNKLSFFVPKLRDWLDRMFMLSRGDELIALYKDANNQVNVFGSLDNPLRFEFNKSTGTRANARGGYDCALVSEGVENSFYYDGAVAVMAGAFPYTLPLVLS